MIINKLKKALSTIFQLSASEHILQALLQPKRKTFVCATGEF
jgi:hypothetical protein